MKFYPISDEPAMCQRQVFKKLLLVMKLTTLIITIALLQASAKSFSQVSLNVTKAPFASVLKTIEKQTGYAFVYDESTLKTNSVTLHLKNATLDETLKELLSNQPINYQVVDKNIVLTLKEPTLFEKVKSAMSVIDVSGKVVNESGEPLAGATVKVKDALNSTTSDAKGFFTLRSVYSEAVIVISYVGFEPQEFVARGINVNAVITLKATSTNLKEVMVNKGYYSEKQRLSTGDVTVVSSKELEQQPVSNPLIALEGRVPAWSSRKPPAYPVEL